ncbi:MAG: hypothetical protein GEU80_13425 [Dehalococcoidia bacterium]|nr:hypothetical protein [Dehalococcoidia bacterium]
MGGLWHGLAVAEEAAIAGSGAANAAFFARRAAGLHGPRRLAAAVLAALFGGVAIEAVGDLALGAGGTGADVVLGQTPLLLAMAAAGWLTIGGRP